MRFRRALVIVSLLGGCGGASGPSARASGAATSGGERAPVTLESQARRIHELEGQLARRTVEVEQLRAGLAELRASRGASTRIGAGRATGELLDDVPAPSSGDDTASRGREEGPALARGSEARPVLRLHGSPRPAGFDGVAALPGPLAPASVAAAPSPASFERLPFAGVPGFPEPVPAIPDAPVAVVDPPAAEMPAPRVPGMGDAGASAGRQDDAPVAAYRAALAHVEARRWAEALPALEQFARAHADHPYADNALYWQGEVLAAQREYRRAIDVLERMIARYPEGNKVPDAILRVGLCHQRLGDTVRARAAFQRVRTQFPESVAARMASREET
jgi:tol-pal system protein YbgF